MLLRNGVASPKFESVLRNVALYDSKNRRFPDLALDQVAVLVLPGSLCSRRLHRPAHAFHFTKDPQQISAKNFVNVAFVVAPL